MIYLHIVIIVQVILYSALINGQTATCTRFESEKKIDGIQGYAMFKKYENQCGDNTSVVLKYTNCHFQIFPNLRTIYWFCKGYCQVEMTIHVDVIGCLKGNYNIYFLFIFRE